MAWWEALLNLGTAGVALATKAIPDDEYRKEVLKARFPKIYARNKKHILQQAYRWWKRHKGGDIGAYVDFIAVDEDDKIALAELLKEEERKWRKKNSRQ